jgi:protoheme IX farnesyltransferase
MSGLIYLVAVVPLGLIFIGLSILMMRKKDNKTAMQTFAYSIIYITVLFAVLLLDHYVMITL